MRATRAPPSSDFSRCSSSAGAPSGSGGAIQAAALSAGLAEAAVGPAYLNEVLEPVLQALEQRIAALAARDELHPTDVRVAALELLAPVFLALLHQDALSGTRCRPLDMDTFLSAHLDHILRAWRGDTMAACSSSSPPFSPPAPSPTG